MPAAMAMNVQNVETIKEVASRSATIQAAQPLVYATEDTSLPKMEPPAQMWMNARLTTVDAKELASTDKDPISASAPRDFV